MATATVYRDNSPAPKLTPTASYASLPNSTNSHDALPPILFNTAIFDTPSTPKNSYVRETTRRPYDIAVSSHSAHDSFSATAPVTPPIYSPVQNTSFQQMMVQTPSSISTASGTLQGQSRSMSIQSLVSIGTQDTRESSIDDMGGTTEYEGSEVGSAIGSVSIEDPEVRMAAEALGDLRADFASPRHTSVMSPPPEEKPLINLIGGVHPYVGTAMNLSRRAYRGGKHYSPRFRYGAEIVERAAGPMSTVVSFAARSTGVEGVLRRGLEARQPSGETLPQSMASEATAKTKKRRKTARPTDDGNTAMDIDDPDPDADVDLTHKHDNSTDLVEVKKPADENWQRRLILQTAGMGAALSEESLKSLKYCFDWLRWANAHLDQVIVALKSVLDEWDSTQSQYSTSSTDIIPADSHQIRLQKRIDELKGDVVITLKKVVDIVSTYAGASLPQNARLYVKQCLTSLPQRWARVAAAPIEPSTSTALVTRPNVAAQGETNRRVLLLAKEGLDMLHQVSSIVEGTLVRAEEWCDRLGRRRPSATGFGEVGWEEREAEPDGVERLIAAAQVEESVKDR